MRRFYTDPIAGRTEVTLDAAQTHHLRNVLRMKPKSRITLIDGTGTDYLGIVEAFSEQGAIVSIVDAAPSESEMRLEVVICQAVIKGTHFDYVIQKAVETGAAAFIPYLAARCVRIPKNPHHFVERAQRIADEAAKQCGRGRIPIVEPIVTFAELVTRISAMFTIFAYEQERTRTLKQLLKPGCPEQAAVVIGPEGGFTEDEARQLTSHGAHVISLGPRILRAETAAPYVLAQLNYACGE